MTVENLLSPGRHPGIEVSVETGLAQIYFSVVQRKVVTPNDFNDLDTLEQQLLAFGRRYQQIAAPFQWTFTRQDLDRLLAKTDTNPATALAA